MKTRCDFVSNSSSSSFVFALDFKKYGFEEFVKNVCDQCNDETNRDPEVDRANEAVLKYCLQFYELLFLGSWKVGRKTHLFRRHERGTGKLDAGYMECENQLFEDLKADYFDPKRVRFRDPSEKATMIDQDTIEIESDDVVGEYITVTKHQMSDVIRNDWSYRRRRRTAEQRRKCVEKIKEIVLRQHADQDGWRSPYSSNTFQVTLGTIRNTRDMIAEGLDVRLSGWQADLDALEARIKSGETIFYTECGDGGEGTDDSRLYSLNGQYPFEGIPVQNVRNGKYED